MSSRLQDGHISWGMTRDTDGHRTYKIAFKAEAAVTDGPAVVLNTPGLPSPGSFWSVDGDSDPWATCKLDASVTPMSTEEPNAWWRIECTFSTKNDAKKCKDTQIDDPLLEPQKLSGSFVRYQEEATEDRHGFPILTSSHEVVRGKQVEFDANRGQVKVEQNSASLELELFGPMVDTLNDATMWGLPPRCIKLSEATWERKFYGTCFVYYTRSFVFDINVKKDPDTGELVSGWDRELLDEGSKVLHGHWDKATGRYVKDLIGGQPPDKFNPQHFDRFKDRRGENCRVILDGDGMPAEVDTGTGTASNANPAGKIHVEKYEENDLLLLGVPTVLA